MEHHNDQLAKVFRRFSEHECADVSPLYGHLSGRISEDDLLLELAAEAAPGQPVPNLLFGAVHYLLLRDPANELAQFYASLTRDPAPLDEAFRFFRAFCTRKYDALSLLLRTRRVQTNEVRRCAYLMPAFCIINHWARGKPLALIEVGASAGLNLLFDRYGYDFGEHGRFGDTRSGVLIKSEMRGAAPLGLMHQLPRVTSRVGIDLNPLDITRDDDATWLRALIWPEQRDRSALLKNAITIARSATPQVIAANATDAIGYCIQAAPDDTAVCVFHTHTLNQFSRAARATFAERLNAAAKHRDAMFQLSAEWIDTAHPRLDLTTWTKGQSVHQTLADCAPHGAWSHWVSATV